MDEARCEELGRVVTSEELYIIDNVRSLSFSCDECAIELLPCSFLKDVNLRKPYFKARKAVNHKQGCDAEGESKIRLRGAIKRLSSSEGFPLVYPNRFKLRKDDLVEPEGVIEPSGTSMRRAYKTNRRQGGSNSRKPNYETTSFKSIVNQYFDFPHDRDRALVFEDVVGGSYGEIFRKIISTRGRQKFLIQGDTQKVYYSALPWKLCQEDGDILKIELSPGRWVEHDGKRVNERPYYLEIDSSAWPEQSRTKFLNEYRKVIELVRGTDKKAAIAFVGKQDTSDDFFRFNAADRRLIAFKIFNDA
ncbi:hypothetical protein Q9247_10870 [Halomonas meridiana]|uniref:hypothetical protein n=1 Tax=Vreelandella aquamarina TaxID=77097 RepID=UPI00273BB1F1|nr:hypothetical protein [Halomonas meridiana]MDP4558184.1 hypothetical protein [Halomonas meridiana]